MPRELDDSGLSAQIAPPQFSLTPIPLPALTGATLVALPVIPGAGDAPHSIGPGAQDLMAALGADPIAMLAAERASGDAGEVVSVPLLTHAAAPGDLRRLVFVGVGQRRPADFRRAGAAVARASRDRDLVATTVPAVGDQADLEAFVEGAIMGSFGFHWRSTGPAWTPVARILLAGVSDLPSWEPALARAVAIGGAGWRARALATVPANLKTPAWLAAEAAAVAAEAGLRCEVWEEDALVAAGFSGVLAVGRAASAPPRLIRLDYVPAKARRRAPRVVLVGKGITFDSGGLSIKPVESMLTMKRDMTGGGIVIAVMAALAEVGCRVKVTGLVPAAENAISGDALRPGDVIRHHGGRTTEVSNTDSEGRLILADALAYAVEELAPAAVVDVATLTGAVRVALGQRTGGMFATHDALAAQLAAAGDAAGEPLWRLPLVGDYEDKLASKVADADNSPGGPGAIMAALFLRHFVGDVPWAHLDVAGAGDSTVDEFEWSIGPTGFGARALARWLASPSPLEGIA